MQRFLLAAASVMMLFASSEAVTFAASTNTVMVGVGPQGGRVLLTFRFDPANGAAYAFTADHGLVALPIADQQSHPLPAVAVVLEKVPGPPLASRAILPDPRGVRSLGAHMPAGTYNVVVYLPLHAASRPTRKMATPSGAANVILTFHVIVDARGNMRMNPRQPPTVTGSQPIEPTR